MLTAEQIAAIAAKALEDKKAKDVKVLRTTEHTVLADYFVICNGTSSTHIKALVDEVDKQLSEAGEPPTRRDEARKFYDLERLWSDAAVVDPATLSAE